MNDVNLGNISLRDLCLYTKHFQKKGLGLEYFKRDCNYSENAKEKYALIEAAVGQRYKRGEGIQFKRHPLSPEILMHFGMLSREAYRLADDIRNRNGFVTSDFRKVVFFTPNKPCLDFNRKLSKTLPEIVRQMRSEPPAKYFESSYFPEYIDINPIQVSELIRKVEKIAPLLQASSAAQYNITDIRVDLPKIWESACKAVNGILTDPQIDGLTLHSPEWDLASRCLKRHFSGINMDRILTEEMCEYIRANRQNASTETTSDLHKCKIA